MPGVYGGLVVIMIYAGAGSFPLDEGFFLQTDETPFLQTDETPLSLT
jgi:hypothetical protein